MDSVLKIYLAVRRPRNFLVLLLIFIAISVLAHHLTGYDVEWGVTNLSLSIEATIAGAVLMVVAEESAQLQRCTVESQGKMLEALVSMAEAEREALLSQGDLLRAIKSQDERLLAILERNA